MARPKKGRIPPQLRPYLFKKGHGRKPKRKLRPLVALSRSVKRSRTKNPARRSRAPRPVLFMVTARKGRERLRYNGRNFTARGRAKPFGNAATAASLAYQLKRRYAAALRAWTVNAEVLA